MLERFAGRGLVVEVRSNRMPDGGLVTTVTDITPSVEAAEQLERANTTLERRVRDRTAELTRLNAELARRSLNLVHFQHYNPDIPYGQNNHAASRA